MWEWVLMIVNLEWVQIYSFTVQEHDCYCFRYVAKAKPTNMDREENVFPTYKYVVSRLHGPWSNTVFRRGKCGELCCIQEKLRERWWIKALWFPGKEKRASTQEEMYINCELHNVTWKNNCENNPYSQFVWY